MQIADIFGRTRIRLDHVMIKQPAEETVVFRLNGFAHEMDVRSLTHILREYDIDLKRELTRLPHKEYDNRPIWKKAMDAQMGKAVDFHRAPCYPPIHPDRLKAELRNMYINAKELTHEER